MNINKRIKFQLDNKANAVLNSREVNLKSEIKIFLDFVQKTPLLNAIYIELEQVEFDFDTHLQNGRNRRLISFPNDYNKKISLCLSVIRNIMEGKWGVLNTRFLDITSSRNVDNISREVARQYFYPLYMYFCEKIAEKSTMLYLLMRYRHRTEWFHKRRLFELYNSDTKHGEDNLTLDLQEYLHSEGIDYPFSTPHSPSGRTDVVSLL